MPTHARVPGLFLACLIAGISAASAAQVREGAEAGAHPDVAPETILTVMRRSAPAAGIFFEKGSFTEERFTYVGRIAAPAKLGWHVALLDTTRGSAGRSTARLLVFLDSMQYLGQYSHFAPRAARVVDHALVFDDVRPDQGDRIDFGDDGPPARVRIDGEFIDFYR